VRWTRSAPIAIDTAYRETRVLPYSTEGGKLYIEFRESCSANANRIEFEKGSIDGATMRLLGRLRWSSDPEIVFTCRAVRRSARAEKQKGHSLRVALQSFQLLNY
jgi:hypothetical protein